VRTSNNEKDVKALTFEEIYSKYHKDELQHIYSIADNQEDNEEELSGGSDQIK
jgi:hypothetical protein